ncbi:MAG: histidine phosphatase family protein [Angelakisella sp.]
MATTVYLVRHGTTEFNIDGRFQGTLQIPLNAQGLFQAQLLADSLATVALDGVYASPLLRALQTAEAIALPHGLTTLPCADLREVFGGDLQGNTGTENDARFPEVMENFRRHPSLFVAPRGESAQEVYTRMVRAMEELVTQNPGRTIAVVSHGFAIQAYLAYVTEHRFEEMRLQIVGNASVTILRYVAGQQPEVVALNVQEHLPPALRFGVAATFMKA